MKVTCINGSRAYLIGKFIEGFAQDAETVKHCVGEADLRFCKGCKKCYDEGKCVQDDDVRKIVGDIVTSDIVLIAAPSYWAGVPAQLKTLFDRTMPYGDTNPNRILKADKRIRGIAVAVRVGMREQENELILNSIEHYFGHLGIETVRRISITRTDTLEDLLGSHADVIKQIRELGKSLGSAEKLC